MRRWIAIAARLYPRSWRERYGPEFDAVLENAPANWRQFANVLRAALGAQLAANAANLKFIGVAGLTGAVLAAAASFAVPAKYVSSAVVRVEEEVTPGVTVLPEVLQRMTDDQVEFLRSNLLGIQTRVHQGYATAAQRRSLGLYVPPNVEMWSLVDEAIRSGGEIRVEQFSLPGDGSPVLRVSFADPDGRTAQTMATNLLLIMARLSNLRASGWSLSRHLLIAVKLDPIEPASLPLPFEEQRKSLMVASGLTTGFLFGALTIFLWKHPNIGLRLAAYSIAGCLLAGAASFAFDEQYTATAGFRLAPPRTVADLANPGPARPFREQAVAIGREVLDGDDFWNAVTARPFLRTSVEQLRKDRARAFQMQVSDDRFQVAVSCDKRNMPALLASELTQAVAERYRQESQVDGHIMGTVLSPPEPAISTHYRLELTLAGAILGLMLATLGVRVPLWSPEFA
jgi:hypothetical protein